jgi:hypothetical protein
MAADISVKGAGGAAPEELKLDGNTFPLSISGDNVRDGIGNAADPVLAQVRKDGQRQAS